LAACLKVIGQAVERARAGGPPQLVVASILRLAGHGEHDDASYIDPALKAAAVGRDCLKLAEQKILDEAWATEADLKKWRAEYLRETEDTVAIAQRDPVPDPNDEDWCALATRHLSEGFIEE
jgi:pyruvate dehydrogenase E1 component alpha subunit/2-oxoisovalerate dehydrogenase E1 component alpha subunit